MSEPDINDCPTDGTPAGKAAVAAVDAVLAADAPKPGDWMEVSQTLANIGHALGGYAIPLTAAFVSYVFFAHAWAPPLVVQTMLATYVLVKEYWYDLKFESNETVRSSTVDALGYLAGGIIAWALILPAFLGHW